MFSKVRAAVRYSLAYRAMQRGNWHKVVAHLNGAIRLFPDQPLVLCNRGVGYQGIGDHRRAALDFSRAIELDPALGMAYFNRGVSEKALGDFSRAVADHSKAIALNPAHADAYGEQGVAYCCQHEYDLAIANLTRAMTLDPDNPSHPKHRGYARFDRGDFAAAAADLRLSLHREADPYAMLFCYLALAKILLSGQDREAVEQQLQADAQSLSRSVWPSKVIDLYLGSSTPETLLASLTDAEEIAEAHFYFGQWYLLKGERTRGVEELRQAVQRCPTSFFNEHTAAVAELRRLGCI